MLLNSFKKNYSNLNSPDFIENMCNSGGSLSQFVNNWKTNPTGTTFSNTFIRFMNKGFQIYKEI